MAGHIAEADRQVFIGGCPVLGEAEDGNAGGIDDARHTGLARRAHQISRAVHIDVINFLRLRDPQPVVRCNVIEGVAAFCRRLERSAIGEIAGHALDVETIDIAAVACAAGQARGRRGPSATSKRTTAEPRNPVAPVIRVVILLRFFVARIFRGGSG